MRSQVRCQELKRLEIGPNRALRALALKVRKGSAVHMPLIRLCTMNRHWVCRPFAGQRSASANRRDHLADRRFARADGKLPNRPPAALPPHRCGLRPGLLGRPPPCPDGRRRLRHVRRTGVTSLDRRLQVWSLRPVRAPCTPPRRWPSSPGRMPGPAGLPSAGTTADRPEGRAINDGNSWTESAGCHRCSPRLHQRRRQQNGESGRG